ncbi:MAG: cell wall-binding repeat-containing protein [Coriobacteriia bacterium]
MRARSVPRTLVLALAFVLVVGMFPSAAPGQSASKASAAADKTLMEEVVARRERKVTQEEREAAAMRLAKQKAEVAAAVEAGKIRPSAITTPGPGDVPDYYAFANWAYTPPLRKFVDTLPGLGSANANNLGQYIPVGHPDTRTFPGSDYYEIELRQFTEQVHSDLPPTTFRGYVQVNNGTNAAGTAEDVAPDPIHYLGVTIVASRDKPVRIKFTNKLPTGAGGDLFIPVDESVMGAGAGPIPGESYTQNRATLHLHGGRTPWISDGTPHQWITPADETTPYTEGVSVENVPDMPDPGDGSMTFFYSNQQSARLMFYHDHSYGITRLNVYAGEAAGYMIADPTEQQLVADGLIPEEQIPLIIQDKSFVDSETIGITDPTWRWGTGPDNNGDTYPDPKTGDLWMPHVYIPAQNPYDAGGVNPYGRWHYGPWFWPPTKVAQGPIPNPYYDPVNAPWEGPEIPGTPDPSMGMESFFDTPMVNGTAYPTLEVDPKSYRFRVLNAANDRFWNLQLYESVPTIGAVRSFGADRYITAAEGARLSFPGWDGVQHVVITSGEDSGQVDALSSAGLAGAYNAPLLLTQRSQLPGATRDALIAMPDGIRVHIVGGTTAVTAAVFNAIQSIPGVASVDRISGANRYATAAAVATRMKSVLGAAFPTSAFVVNGANPDNFYDSLVSGPASVRTHFPILLVASTSIPAETATALTSLGISRVFLVGGTVAVSDAVATSLGVAAGDRISGANRYATAVAFAERAKAEGWLTFANVGIAVSTIDALSGSVAMGHLGGPILLSTATALPAETRAFLVANQWEIELAQVFGGTTAVTQAVLNSVYEIISKDTEVGMVPAAVNAAFPTDWPIDGREGGVPDPKTAGPEFIQIGSEGGFLPAPVVLPTQPITWNLDPTTFNFGNVDLHTLLLGPAERADVIVDFSKYAGKTLIMYNDAPAAFPALDARYDFYTGSPDLTDTGGYWGTKAGFGPNTRTVMQIKVAAATPAPAFDLAALEAEFASTATTEGVFARSQDPIIVGQAAYNSAYDTTFSATWPGWGVVNIQDNELNFNTLDSTTVTLPLEPKAIQDEMGEAFDTEYGRMSGFLGLELPDTISGNQNFMLYGYESPPVELLEEGVSGTLIGETGDNTQIWKITHNGVDTHPIHFHLYDVQVINRVGWDGAIRMPDANELGWKETVRVSPLEDTIVALRPILPVVPFDVPNSVRPLNPAMALGEALNGAPGGFVDPSGEPIAEVVNHLVNFGWEYVVHCHILSHEEMDMMHGVALAVKPNAPTGLSASVVAGPAVDLAWTDASHNETGFRVQRAEDASFTVGVTNFTVGEGITTYTDGTIAPATTYYYRVAAINTIGDTTDYTIANPAAIGFPTKTAMSVPSNVVTVP